MSGNCLIRVENCAFFLCNLPLQSHLACVTHSVCCNGFCGKCRKLWFSRILVPILRRHHAWPPRTRMFGHLLLCSQHLRFGSTLPRARTPRTTRKEMQIQANSNARQGEGNETKATAGKGLEVECGRRSQQVHRSSSVISSKVGRGMKERLQLSGKPYSSCATFCDIRHGTSVFHCAEQTAAEEGRIRMRRRYLCADGDGHADFALQAEDEHEVLLQPARELVRRNQPAHSAHSDCA